MFFQTSYNKPALMNYFTEKTREDKCITYLLRSCTPDSEIWMGPGLPTPSLICFIVGPNPSFRFYKNVSINSLIFTIPSMDCFRHIEIEIFHSLHELILKHNILKYNVYLFIIFCAVEFSNLCYKTGITPGLNSIKTFCGACLLNQHFIKTESSLSTYKLY